ncbi:hypothetical protein CMI37_16175 [Candidatus Pacearchaeota archaeon]|nr:hypothetical protein [Candidatus Pacearchaeota archaeon]
MPPKARSVKIPFPLKGMHEGASFEDQPSGTTVDCQNVRSFPADSSEVAAQNAKASGRARGGQRPGLSKYMPTQWASNLTHRPSFQDLNQIVYSELTPNTGEGHVIMQTTSGTGGYTLVDNQGVTVGTGGAGETYQMAEWGEDGFGYVITATSDPELVVRKISKTGAVSWTWTSGGSMPTIGLGGATEVVRGMGTAQNTLFIWLRNVTGVNGEAIYRVDTGDGLLRDTTYWKRSENQSTGVFENFYPSTDYEANNHNLMSISRGVIGMLCFNNSGAQGATTNITSALDHDVSNADLTTAIEGLTNLSSANVTVGGGELSADNDVTITFSGNKAAQSVSKLIFTDVDLSGGGTNAISTITDGNTEQNEVQKLTVAATGGTFKLAFDGSISLQGLSLETGAQLFCRSSHLYGVKSGGAALDDVNQELSITSDEAGNFYTLSKYSTDGGSNYNFVLTKFDTVGDVQWTRSHTGTTRDVAYDYDGQRLVCVGGSVQGTTHSFAIVKVVDGTVLNSQDAHGTATWNSCEVDEQGGYRLARNATTVNLARMTNATVPVEDWIVSVSGSNNNQERIGIASIYSLEPSNQLATRQTVQVAVAGGVVRKFTDAEWIDVTNSTNIGSPPLDKSVPVIFSASLGGKLFFADGRNIKYYDPNDPQPHGSIKTWALDDGTLPVSTRDGVTGEMRPRLIEEWRGRIVMSGLSTDPQEWYMSKVGDAFDWEQAPTVLTETTATSGTNAPAGKMPDIITGMIPISDDVLVFGGDHTIWMLSGDPMQGGRWDLMTDTIGMAWGRAWCRDNGHGFYMMGSKGGVYYGAIGQGVKKVSAGLIDERLSDIDLSAHLVRFLWNEKEQGVHIFITPREVLLNTLNSSTTSHLFYDTRTESWWLDKFADKDHNPKAVLTIDGDLAGDRAIILGGWDGYLRKWDESEDDDDGTAISSHVYLGPIEAGSQLSSVRIDEIQSVLARGSDDVDFDLYRGVSAEQAYRNTTATFSGTWSAGRNRSERRKIRGRAIYLKMSNTSVGETWAFEELLCMYKETGRSAARSP